ncbi:MAG TPA: iron uptake transporter permease EfeU [Rhodopila sp.]
MLATFIIGLREGIEAALIVGIIAAFLRKNGKSLAAMWFGVGLAVILSIAVGVGLDLVEQALPQAAQEGMEAAIGAVAIFFVTGMIVWMNTHARNMKKELEAQAAEALSHASAYALAVMAFLAVLREGFETSVFLLATFSAAQSATLAATGAVIGIAIAVVIGGGIYAGGVKLNLGRFFRITGAFLILVAAGLAITALRSAHEAGWLNAGQQATVSLSWLVAPGTVQSALITGVLGIPADPRLIEVLGWLAYLVPVTLYVYWPHAYRPSRRGVARLQFAVAIGLAAVAAVLATALPRPDPAPVGPVMVVAAEGDTQAIGTAQLRRPASGTPAVLDVALTGEQGTALPLGTARREQHGGVSALAWTVDNTGVPANAPNTLTLDQIVALSGGRIPVGLNPAQHPGPFTADWSMRRAVHVWAADGMLLDATARDTTIVTLSGSGLQTPRTLLVRADDSAPARNWQVAASYRDQVAASLTAAAAAREEWRFWAIQLPILLCIAAGLIVLAAGRTLRQARRSSSTNPAYADRRANTSTQGTPHGAR